MACVTLGRVSVRGRGLHRLVLWIHISTRMEWLPITVSLCHHDCSYHQELMQAPISQHPLTPITANGLPDEARGVIPALMINNIKMKTLSILQSFWYNILLSYGQETSSTIHSATEQRLRSGADMSSDRSLEMNESDWENHPFLDDGFKTQAAVYLGVVIVFLIISSHRIETTWVLEKNTRLDLIFTFRSSAASSQNPNDLRCLWCKTVLHTPQVTAVLTFRG